MGSPVAPTMPWWGLINAALIGVDFFVIAYGVYLAKVKRDFVRHPKVMIAAAIIFLAFLASFLVKIATVGVQAAPVWTGMPLNLQPRHILYLHEAVALVTIPVVAAAYWFAYKRDFAKHKRIVRYAWPLWLFESAFGIVEFFILYYG